MAGIFGYSREAVRVKVKKCEGALQPEWRKFSVDPQITSLEVLYSILAKAFDIKSDFAISYRTKHLHGHEIYLAVLSDWDLDAAFLRAHNLSISAAVEPCLYLKVDIKPFSEAPDWDATSTTSQREVSPLQQSIGVGQKYVQTMQTRLPGLIMNQMEKTFSMVTRALNFVEDQNILQPPRAPLSDTEFRGFLDSVGQIVFPHDLRKVIYSGGIDPSLRRVVWKHILNVYPDGMTGRERMDYMKRKAAEYQRLRDTWRTAVQRGSVVGELAYVTSMVRKDVLRTDRLHPFYAGSDDNQNIAALFNILTTYALNHPAVSYCQGMSDIASPLLVTMGDEAQAYICFCAVMTRLNANFMLDGIAMTLKFTHLAEALQHYDPEFYEYLKLQQADDLLFCYRWLLLEMKREFAFEDSLRMLEVLWSALPSEPPATELALFDKEFVAPPTETAAAPTKSPAVIMRTPRENAYTKICALRRQSSALSLVSSTSSPSAMAANITVTKSLDSTKRLNHSLDENITRRSARNRSVTKSHQSLDESKMLLMLDDIGTDDDLVDSAFVDDNDETDITSVVPLNVLEINKNEENLLRSRSTSPVKLGIVEDVTTADNSHSTKHSSNYHHHNHGKHKSVSSPLNSISALSKQLHHHRKGGHFKDLKERIAASKKGIFSSLDTGDTVQSNGDASDHPLPLLVDDKKTTKTQKVVKNFNEFLNFATINKSRIADKLNTTITKPAASVDLIDVTNATSTPVKPLIKLTNSSFDESDSSSIITEERSFDVVAVPIEEQQSVQLVAPPQPLQLQLISAGNGERRISMDGSSPDDSQEYFPMTTSMTRELRLELENLDRHVFGNDFQQRQQFSLTGIDTPEGGDSRAAVPVSTNYTDISYTKLQPINSSGDDVPDDAVVDAEGICRCPSDKDITTVMRTRLRNDGDPGTISENAFKRISTCSANADVFIWENPLHQFSPSNTILDFERGTATMTAAVTSDTYDDSEQLNLITPDEQCELEYDIDSVIETTVMGKKSVTPIRLVRKNGEPTKRRSIKVSASKRNSAVFSANDSDSENSSGGAEPWNEPTTRSGGRSAAAAAAAVSPSMPSPVRSNSQLLAERDGGAALLSSSVEEASEVTLTKVAGALPAPHEFGGGNPFLMFLCLTILMQHRNYVIKSGMDYNEMAMHFDKMVRKHNVTRVLNQARRMYADYLKSQKMLNAVGIAGSGGGGVGSAADVKPDIRS